MTDRDTFAVAALTGIIAAADDSEIKEYEARFLAKQAWLVADAMLAARGTTSDHDAAPPAGSVALTDEERRELEAAASDYERGGGRIVYGRQTYLRRGATLRGLLSRASGQTSGQDSRVQIRPVPENTPACNVMEPAKQAVTLTDAERASLDNAARWLVEIQSADDPRAGECAATIRGLLARAAKEGDA